MKPIIALILAIGLTLTLCSCGEKDRGDTATNGGEPLSTSDRADDDVTDQSDLTAADDTTDSISESDTIIPD